MLQCEWWQICGRMNSNALPAEVEQLKRSGYQKRQQVAASQLLLSRDALVFAIKLSSKYGFMRVNLKNAIVLDLLN